MELGAPEKEYVSEPLESPVPDERAPAPEPTEAPVEKPEKKPEREKVPA